ncbi:MAG: hypothetical protein WAS51_01935 [Ilumatobacteraceae bacterium]
MTNVFPITRHARHVEPWPEAILVVAWRDPVIEQAAGAIATTSDEFLTWWTNTLGPSSVLVARHLALYAADGEVEWPLDDLARTFGLGTTQLGHTLDRLARFGVIARHGTTVAVRMMLGPLTRQQVERLPGYLADAYGR